MAVTADRMSKTQVVKRVQDMIARFAESQKACREEAERLEERRLDAVLRASNYQEQIFELQKLIDEGNYTVLRIIAEQDDDLHEMQRGS